MLKRIWVVALVLGLTAQLSWSEDKVLRFAWWGGGDRHEATLRALRLFEQKNPGVKIKWEYSLFGGYNAKLASQIANNTEPDVMQINWAWISQFSKDGNGFYDLNKSGAIKKDEFINESWKSGMVNGKLNALPVSNTARVYLWNKTMWDKAGLKLPKTWDDFFAAGKVFEQKLGKDYYPLDGQLYDRFLMAHAYIFQKTGKQWIDPNQPRVALTEAETLEWVKFFNRMVNDHASPTQQYRVAAGTGNSERPTEQIPDWVNGKFAGNYTWDSSFKSRTSTPKGMSFEVGEFLTMPGARNSGFFGRPSMMFAVGKNTRNPEIAAKLVNWLLTDVDAIRILGSTRGAPTSKSQMDVLVKNKTFSELELKALKQLQSTKIDLPSPWLESSEIQAWVRDIFDKLATGKISEAEAAKILVVDANQLLTKLAK